MSTTVIGIDLGTTHSCVAVCRFGKVEIISNDHGNRTTPSCVAFTEDDTLVGEAAKGQAFINPENTIYDAKRLIGRRFNDKTVQSDIKSWPFTVSSKDGFPVIQVHHLHEYKSYSPEEISALILSKMKRTAEAFLESSVSKAVVTVPAYFSEFQRQATICAGQKARLEVIGILSEPTAAAITYGVVKEDTRGNVLVFDLGGGTLDVSIVFTTGRKFIVKATTGNTHLGGQDFNINLVNYFVSLFNRKYGKDLRNSKRALSRLGKECEIAKKQLSFTNHVNIFIDGIIDGIDINEVITRAKFEELNADLFSSTIPPVEEAIRCAGMTRHDIDKVITVGGSSRIPKIQSLLKNFFVDKEIYMPVNPDEAIAYGAGAYAAVLDGVNLKDKGSFVVQDITPLSLGIEVSKDEMSILIPRNSVVPISVTEVYETQFDDQISVSFSVHEGESIIASENSCLGKIILGDIPLAPAGHEKFNVTFSIDTNRVLKVTAESRSRGNRKDIVIDRTFENTK